MKNDYSSKIIVLAPVLDIAEVDSKCQCKTLLKHWENSNQQIAEYCTAHECDSKYEGVFKVKVRDGDIFDNDRVYITPLCSNHSRMENPFKIKKHNPVVSLDKLENCGKWNPSLF